MMFWDPRNLLATARALRGAGVLGMNERNANYILLHNRRCLYPSVDDKLQTKTLAAANGMEIPDLYAVYRYGAETKSLAEIAARHNEFVVKPAAGSGGSGIIVVKGRAGADLRLANRSTMSLEDLDFHIKNILSGIYSLGGQPDKALIEYCIGFDPVFERIAYQGVPDIRIIAYRGVPVMAMVRLPTRQSGGKANLHQGAIGAGIDLATGRTLTAVYGNSIVSEHPDTLAPITGIEIPHFAHMLEIAVQCNAMTGLGYVGVDLVLDQTRGPLMLEINARPGLAIQIANRAGLGSRLSRVEEAEAYKLSQEERIAFARSTFGASF